MSTDPSEIIIKPPIRTKSSILKYLDDNERAELTTELFAETSQWLQHPLFNAKNPRANVLGHGRSCHPYNIDFRGNVYEDNRHLFPKTLENIAKWTGENLNNLGRTYWHRLNTNERIELHYDNSNGYFRTIHRYHIYLDVPMDFHIILDGELWNVYPEKKLTNALVKFNLFDWHFFVNYTPDPMYMLVFDFYP